MEQKCEILFNTLYEKAVMNIPAKCYTPQHNNISYSVLEEISFGRIIGQKELIDISKWLYKHARSNTRNFKDNEINEI